MQGAELDAAALRHALHDAVAARRDAERGGAVVCSLLVGEVSSLERRLASARKQAGRCTFALHLRAAPSRSSAASVASSASSAAAAASNAALPCCTAPTPRLPHRPAPLLPACHTVPPLTRRRPDHVAHRPRAGGACARPRA
eukprot:6805261-Prymnesium_polylepis.1